MEECIYVNVNVRIYIDILSDRTNADAQAKKCRVSTSRMAPRYDPSFPSARSVAIAIPAARITSISRYQEHHRLREHEMISRASMNSISEYNERE